MNNEYLKKAQKLKDAGFWMAGYGNFDITTEELALILQLIEENDFKSIAELYDKLEAIRL